LAADAAALLESPEAAGGPSAAVTTLWVTACAQNRRRTSPAACWPLFAPLPALPRPFPEARRPRVCLSLYPPTIRTAMTALVESMGGRCSCRLVRGETTHLVAPRPEGPKVADARQWGSVRIVSERWLLHVARNGYEDGCEAAFALADEPTGGAPAAAIASASCTTASDAIAAGSGGGDGGSGG
ncbi:unnamed protein product, partial [Phaeothamnion confervicola]